MSAIPVIAFENLVDRYKVLLLDVYGVLVTLDMVMIGDQLEIDTRGARAFGIDSAPVAEGCDELGPRPCREFSTPTWLLESLTPRRP